MASLLSLDAALFALLNGTLVTPGLDVFMIWVTGAGKRWWWILLFATPFGLWIGRNGWRRFWILLLPTAFLADTACGLLKLLVARHRPWLGGADVRLIVPIDTLGPYGFPSGHATSALALAVLAWHYGDRAFENVLLFIMAGIVCWSRVYIGVHYPLDVLAGAALGAAIASAVHAADRRWAEKSDRPQLALAALTSAITGLALACRAAASTVR